MKIELDYDPVGGQISDPSNGLCVGHYVGLEHCESSASKREVFNVSELCKLRSAGFDAGEIVELIQAQKAG